MLSVTLPDEIDWTWSEPDPDHWNVEQSDDGVSGWSVFDSVSGGTHSYFSIETGEYYRVSPRDGADNPVGPDSNVVFVPP